MLTSESIPANACTGAEWLLKSAQASGIEVCFANPGTTELPFVAALENVPSIRPVLGVFEGVCSGAADGYYRISGKPAMVLTHLGPGFANAIANLHNARRARSSILNVIGDHQTWHVEADPPLASDIRSLAAPVSAGVWYADSAAGLCQSVQGALSQVVSENGRIASLILPMDMQSVNINVPLARSVKPENSGSFDGNALDALAHHIREGRRVLLFLGAGSLTEPALRQAVRFTGLDTVQLIGETFPARSEHGGGLPAIQRFPYLPEQAHPFLLQFDCVALFEAEPPVAFFGANDYPSYLGDPKRMLRVVAPGGVGEHALAALADALHLPSHVDIPFEPLRVDHLSDELTAQNAAQVVAACLPNDAIVSAEGGTLGFPFNQVAAKAQRHSTIVLTGGAIGQGLPSAFGASIAAPQRKVIALQSDGSALFTPQALWSMARESANVVVIIAANQRYQILQNEMKRTGYVLQSPAVQSLLSLASPQVSWVAMAQTFGVAAERAASTSALRDAFRRGLEHNGPYLIEAMLG